MIPIQYFFFIEAWHLIFVKTSSDDTNMIILDDVKSAIIPVIEISGFGIEVKKESASFFQAGKYVGKHK